MAAALNSLISQSYRNVEILISDDCSQDGTFEILQQYRDSDDRITLWRNESRLGLFNNYNQCLSRARGELIKPFAQDDLLRQDAIEKMVEAFESHPVSIVSSAKNVVGGASHSLKEEAEALSAGLHGGREVIQRCLRAYRNLVGEPVCVLFDARYADTGFDDSYYSLGDLEYWFRLLEHGDLFYINEPLVTFRSHEDSASARMVEDMTWVLDFFRLGREYSSYLQEMGLSERDYFSGFIDSAGTLIDRLTKESNLSIAGLSGFKEVAFYAMIRAAELAAKARQYDAVVSSTSWRITSPLRSFKTRIEKGKPG